MFNEAARLDALHQLNLLDTPPSESFDRITRMAAQIFHLPIAAVSLTDRDRQWFKSRVGVDHMSIPREKAPCAQVAEQTAPLVIPDLLTDDYYADSVLAGTGVRFYAGVPLVTRGGFGLGSLCVLGTEPRAVTALEMASLSDLAAMVMSQIELQHAFGRIDPLSGLPNRSQFLEDLDDLSRDTPGVRRLAVLVDLARSEQLNQGIRVIGSGFVDGIVRDAARMLRGALGKDTTAYHVASTQFAFLTRPDVDDAAFVAWLDAGLQKIRQQGGSQYLVTLAIGIAPFVTGVTSAADVLRTAYSAAQDARSSNQAVSFYSLENDGVHARRYQLLNDFDIALSVSDQLRLVYQPRIDLASGRCSGAEALLRWDHPVLGDVSPGEFIPIIEKTTMVGSTTAWVLDAAIRQLGRWGVSHPDFQLSVNISAANLEEADFAQRVQLTLLKYRVLPDRLELEVIESAVMENPELALTQLEALAEAGVRIAIDDFGTGYSSLAYLQRLPAHVVKVDQSFIRDLEEGSARAQRLVQSMITLSHSLGFRVVAEGVETDAAADKLRSMNCDEAQGYHFARPMECEAFETWLREDGTPTSAMLAA